MRGATKAEAENACDVFFRECSSAPPRALSIANAHKAVALSKCNCLLFVTQQVVGSRRCAHR
jgi:hypothetical protein